MGQVLMGGTVVTGLNLHLSRFGLLASICAAALIVGSAALADPNYYTGCAAANSGSTVTCTVPAGTQGTGVHIDFAGANGTNGVNAAPGGNYTLNSNADFTTASNQNEGVFVHSRGGVGNADVTKGGTRGGDGGVVTITTIGAIRFGTSSVPTTEGTDDGSNPGVWDDPGRAVAVYGASIGGTGGGGAGSVGGGDGGNGGHAGPLTIANSGTLNMNGVNLVNGGAGILGSVVTGGGGEQNDTAGDQHGGAAGDGNTLTISNSGAIVLSAPTAGHYIWGIGA